MPLYEFECKTCGTKTTRLQKYDDPAPTCDTDDQEMVRLISSGGFELKGTGWYATDFKGK